MATPAGAAAEVIRRREEQHLDTALSALIEKSTELKKSLESLVTKVERDHQNLSWPSFLDSMLLISGQLTTLRKCVSSEKFPRLINYITLPISLSMETNQTLQEITDGRVSAFNHDVVPNYLRTKPEPEVEERLTQTSQLANTVSQSEATKQIDTLNRLSANALDLLESAKQMRENETNRRTTQPALYRSEDTVTLTAALTLGKRLTRGQHAGLAGGPPSRTHTPPATPPLRTGNKSASTVRANIKAGASSHPYMRN